MVSQYRRILFFLPILLILMLLWAGCSAAGSESYAAPAAEAPAAYESVATDSNSAAAPAAEMAVAQDNAVVSDGVPMQRQIIARATLELVMSDTQQAVDAITVLINGQGGFIANANLYRSNYSGDNLLQGTIQLRVPAAKLEATLEQLEGLAVEVRTKNISREDVTDQYSDLDAQLRNLSATENELRELLAEVRAKPNATPDDILTVHNSLMGIRGQIEQIQGRKNVLSNLIGLSTIDITITPDVIARPLVDEGWRPLVVVKDATRELVNALQDLTDMGIWFVIYLLPVLLLLCIPLVILVWVARWLIRRINRKPATG